MVKKPSKQEIAAARRRLAERLTETRSEGLIIRRRDGTVERVGKGGKLELVSGPKSAD